MQIGYLEAKQGNQGTYFIGKLDLLNDNVAVALGPNPLKDQFEGAADFEFRFPERNWAKGGNASTKTSAKTGMEYIKGAIVQQGTGTVYVNLYEVFDEKKEKQLIGFNVHYTGDSVASARRRSAGGNMRLAVAAAAVNAPLNDSIPY